MSENESSVVKPNSDSTELFRTVTENTDDAMAGSSAAEGSSQQGEKADQQTMADAIAQQFEKSTGQSSETPPESDTEKLGSESESDKKETADAGKEGQEASETEDLTGKTEQVVESETDKGPVPYDRFNEVLQQHNTYKQELEQVKPKVENYDRIDTFCQEYNITPQQFEQVMKIQALMNTDPAAALKEMLPIVETLQGFVGNKLPADLQGAVDESKITLEYAKELASNRAKLQFGEKKSQFDQQRQQQQQLQQVQRQMTDSIATWQRAKMASDPDYKPKQKAELPDGKWEDVRDKYLAMVNVTDPQGRFINPVRNAQEATALLEKAYAAVNGRGVRKPATKKVPSSNGSSTTKSKSIENAGSMREAMSIAAARHGGTIG